jgi:hypothetical protein
MAAADSSPATFRVSPEERYLLEAVAHYTGKTMSAFVREAALAVARSVVADVGSEAVLEGDHAWSQKGRPSTEERRRALENQRELSADDRNR